MTQILEATFDGEVFKPLTSVKLPKNTRVQLVVNSSDTTPAMSFLDIAEGLNLQGPSDWSLRINEYLNSEAEIQE